MTNKITLDRSLVEQAMKALEDRESTPAEYDTYHALRAALDQSNRQSVHESELMMNDASYRRKFEQTQVGQEHGIK